MSPRTAAGWDRSADLDAVRETYRRYDESERARLWDQRAPGYARLVGDVERHLWAAIAGSMPDTGGVLLDLGCGDGSLATERDRLPVGTEWIGVDIRPEAIDRARQGFPGLRFLDASADELPLEDGSVDVIVARVLFSSLPSPSLEAAVADEAARVLRPTGSIAWLDLRYDNPRNAAVHGVPRRRIAELFPGWAVDLRSAGLLPPIARRLGFTAAVTYPVLAAIPPLRSHLVGRLRPPPSA